MAEHEKSERDTLFLRSAEQLYEALAQNVVNTQRKRFSEMDAFKQEQHTIIARFAYDLVLHTAKSLTTFEGAELEYVAAQVPDLTEWP